MMNFLHIGIKKNVWYRNCCCRELQTNITVDYTFRNTWLSDPSFAEKEFQQQQHGTDYFNRKCVQYLYICIYEAGSDKKKKSFGQINWCLLNIYSPTSTRFYLLASFAFSMYFCWHEVHTNLITKVETELKKSNRRIALIQWGKNN